MRARDVFEIECSICFGQIERPVHNVGHGLQTCVRVNITHRIDGPADAEERVPAVKEISA
jgi:hypothetical protein